MQAAGKNAILIERVRPDKIGRVTIPKTIRAEVGITEDTTLECRLIKGNSWFIILQVPK